MYKRVTGIRVFLWGRPVGIVMPHYGSYYRFQYDEDFVRGGVSIAPFMMPLDGRVYHVADFGLPKGAFSGLPGVFADSLPDSFGNALIDKWLMDQQIPRTMITPLDRLAYVGARGMGALTYEPRRGPYVGSSTAVEMRELVEEARLAMNVNLSAKSGTDALLEILRVGTSAGGAQAKAVVGWNRTTDQFVTGDGDLPAGFEHWIIKFTPRGDPEIGEREYAIHRKALSAGITMSECRLYELDGLRHFMTKRFDRDGDTRYHTQTLCALRHLPHGGPRALYTYNALFDTAIDLGLGYETLEQIFRRMAFNVLIREMDDHTKNFSFLMRENGKWELAPAYDLTGYHFSVEDPDHFDWENRHALSVNGKFSGIGDADLLAVADEYGLGTAKRVLEEVKAGIGEEVGRVEV